MSRVVVVARTCGWARLTHTFELQKYVFSAMYTSLSAKMIAAKNTFFRRSIGPGRPNVLEMKRAVTAEETLIARRKKVEILDLLR